MHCTPEHSHQLIDSPSCLGFNTLSGYSVRIITLKAVISLLLSVSNDSKRYEAVLATQYAMGPFYLVCHLSHREKKAEK